MKPTKPGFYWLYKNDRNGWEPVEVVSNDPWKRAQEPLILSVWKLATTHCKAVDEIEEEQWGEEIRMPNDDD